MIAPKTHGKRRPKKFSTKRQLLATAGFTDAYKLTWTLPLPLSLTLVATGFQVFWNLLIENCPVADRIIVKNTAILPKMTRKNIIACGVLTHTHDTHIYTYIELMRGDFAVLKKTEAYITLDNIVLGLERF